MDVPFWHARSASDVLAAFGTDAKRGLTEDEATLRLQKGKNLLPPPKPDTLLARIHRQFMSPITVVLLAAAAATIFISDYTDALVIAIALLINVVIGVFQEGRASHAFSALAKEEAPRAVVIRDGAKTEIPAAFVVPGDILILSTGAKVAADVRLIEVHGLSIEEAALSGEWVPSEKVLDAVVEEAPLAERTCMAYSGTLVSAGAGIGIVVATGTETEFGAIARELASAPRVETPLQRDLRSVSRLLLILIAISIVVIGVLALLRGMTLGGTILIAIAIAVAAIPEGLPAAVTVVLAIGMERILKAGGLVRNLLAAETLGATSVILTDKTGTLTEGKMKAVGFATRAGTTEDADGPTAQLMLRAAVIASDGYTEEVDPSSPGQDRIIVRGRPVEAAILTAGLEAGFSERKLREEFPRIDELHFSSVRRFGGMLVKENGKHRAYVTGTPELFLAHASSATGPKGGERPFTKEDAGFFEDALLRAAREGKRVLGVGYVDTDLSAFPDEDALPAFLDRMDLIGFIILSDVIRKDAASAVAEMQSAGARVIMLTGDNPETALWFARQVGIAGPDDIAHTGPSLADLSDEELLSLLETSSVFARVAPTDKLRIARILGDAGEVVAMTGDGVNDAPALESAAIGVALGSGTDVAKEASDLVLLDNSFSVITHAIREGRRLRDNVKKLLAYMLSTNMSEIFVITASLAAGLPVPILPTQIMWANLIEGGAMNIALAFEPLYPSAMKRSPKHPDIAQVLSTDLLKLILSVGILTGLMLVSMHFFLVAYGTPEDELRTIMFGAISASSIAGAFSLKSFGTPLWKLSLFSNRVLLVSFCISVALLFVSLFVPPIQMILHTVPVSAFDLGIIALAAIVNLFLIEFAKYIFFIRPAARAEIPAAV